MKKISILFLFASLFVSVDSLQAKKENVLSYYAIRNQVDGQILAGETNLLRFHPVFKHRPMIDTVIVALYYGSDEFTGYAEKRDAGRFWQLTLPLFDLGESIQKIEVEVKMGVGARSANQMARLDSIKSDLVQLVALNSSSALARKQSEIDSSHLLIEIAKKFRRYLGSDTAAFEQIFGLGSFSNPSGPKMLKYVTNRVAFVRGFVDSQLRKLNQAITLKEAEDLKSSRNQSSNATSADSASIINNYKGLVAAFESVGFYSSGTASALSEMQNISDSNVTKNYTIKNLDSLFVNDVDSFKQNAGIQDPTKFLRDARAAFAVSRNEYLWDSIYFGFDEALDEALSVREQSERSASESEWSPSLESSLQLVATYTEMPTENDIYAQEASLSKDSSDLAMGPSVEPADVHVSPDFKRVNILYRNYNDGLRRLPALDPSERVGIFRLRYIPVAVTQFGKMDDSGRVVEDDESELATLLPSSAVAPVFELGFAFGETYAASDQEIISELSVKRLGVALALTSKLFNKDAQLIGAAITYDLNSFVSLGAGVNLAHSDYPPYYSLGVNKRLFERALKAVADGFK